MFNRNFYPTPENVISIMLEGFNIQGKIILEPSAGKGNIIEYCQKFGASEVLSCEIEPDLITILKTKSRFLKPNFLDVTAEEISHVDFIIMNPPFTEEEKHIQHAYDIAPAGCTIISLCNYSMLDKTHYRSRREIKSIIDAYGTAESLGPMFEASERSTSVEIGLIKIFKPGDTSKNEFEGFFMSDEPEQDGEGIIKYDFLRDLVNRYAQAVKIYDTQLTAGKQISSVLGSYFSFGESIAVGSEAEYMDKRAEFKKILQKSGWKTIFNKLELNKYSTRGVMEDINKFIEQQSNVPFTMRNIYKMLEIIVGTAGQRMDKALEEVFDKCTKHTKDNQYNVEGWATNSHYLLNKRFILDYMVEVGFRGEISTRSSSNFDKIEDMQKALCFITGERFEDKLSFYNAIRYRYKLKDANGNYINEYTHSSHVKIVDNSLDKLCRAQKEHPGSVIEDSETIWGQWNEWGFFRFRVYKKGTVHFEFLDADVWGLFNQNIARIKGFPLYEHRTTKSKSKGPTAHETTQANILFEMEV